MTIEIEAGASQNQCSMKLWMAHAFSAARLVRRLSTTDTDLVALVAVPEKASSFCKGKQHSQALAQE